MKKTFSFTYQLKKKTVRDLRIVTETVGELIIGCIGTFNKDVPVTEPYDRYNVEVESILFEGSEILPVIEWADCMDDILDDAIMYFANVCEAHFAMNSFKPVNLS